ncbi:LysR family transcriptional regulator [Pseudomonas sp. 3A(2025)]
MNWDDARIFLALCREHTLRGAARVLAVDQATVGRRLTSLEQALGATLFLRISGGYSLTPAGEAAHATALAMEAATADLQRRIMGMDQRMSGVVRVTTTDSFAIDFIIPALARLHQVHPGIQVQLQTSPQVLDLTKREADIAVRPIRPQNPDLVARRIVRWGSALFASANYLQARGTPEPGSAFAGHDLVVYQPYLDSGREVTLGAEPITHGRLAMTCTSGLMVRQALTEGLGIGELPVPLGHNAGLQRVWPQREPLPYEVWLVTHQDLRHTARVKMVIDALVGAFADHPDT